MVGPVSEPPGESDQPTSLLHHNTAFGSGTSHRPRPGPRELQQNFVAPRVRRSEDRVCVPTRRRSPEPAEASYAVSPPIRAGPANDGCDMFMPRDELVRSRSSGSAGRTVTLSWGGDWHLVEKGPAGVDHCGSTGVPLGRGVRVREDVLDRPLRWAARRAGIAIGQGDAPWSDRSGCAHRHSRRRARPRTRFAR